MDLGDLHIFRSVVQAGGVTRAAEKLNRVQSNVTTRVRQLEADLGVELFVRDGKKLHLSSAGRLLLDYADRLLELAQEAREAVHDAKPRGLLRLGSIESTASVRLPVPMNEYLTRYPDVSLELRIGTPRELAAAVREGELDAALVAEPIPGAPFEKIPLYDEELVIIAAASHPPIKTPHDVAGKPVLAFEAGCPYRQYMEDWFASSGEMSDRVIETSSYHAILGCAVAGMGISMVPRIVLKTFPDLKLLSVHALSSEFNVAPTVFIRRKGAISPKVAALIEEGRKRRPAKLRRPAAGDCTPPTDRWIEKIQIWQVRLARGRRDSQDRPTHRRPLVRKPVTAIARDRPRVRWSGCIRRPRGGCATRRRAL
jgi:DNA-binding transcriptional LysR family regulator